MSELAIVCDNCGAKYRLPASFSGDKAKCKQCGSVIDVAAQKASASAPQKAAPAPTAKPAAAPAAAERPRRSAREEQPAAAEPKSRRGDRAKKDESDGGAAGGRGKRGERGERVEREPKKSNAMLLVGGGVGALAIVAVIVVLSTSGKKDAPEQQQQAQAPAAVKPEQPAPVAPAATPPSAKVDASATGSPAAPAAAPTPEKSPEPTKDAALKTEPAETPKATDAAAKAPGSGAPAATADGDHKEVWERNKTTSMADVFDPKTLGEVSWPSDIPDDKKTEIRGLIGDIVDGGRAGITAKPKVEKLGYDAIFGLVERLRQIDYKSTEEMMTGWELNKLLQTICAGMNTGYAAVQVGEDLDPRKADHNAKTNKAWAQLLTKFPSKEAFETWRTDRLQKGLDKAK